MVGGQTWNSCMATLGPLSLSVAQVPSPALKWPLPRGTAQFLLQHISYQQGISQSQSYYYR